MTNDEIPNDEVMRKCSSFVIGYFVILTGTVAQWQRRSSQKRRSVSSNLTGATQQETQHALAEQPGVLATLSRCRSSVQIRSGVLSTNSRPDRGAQRRRSGIPCRSIAALDPAYSI